MNLSDTGTSAGYSADLAGWMNRCHALPVRGGNLTGFFEDFTRNLCTLQGIYSAWLFNKPEQKSGYTAIAFHSPLNKEENRRISIAFRKRFESSGSLWELSVMKSGMGSLFAGRCADQPVNELRVFMLPGFGNTGRINLVVVGESELEGLLKVALPGIFQNALDYVKLWFEENGSFYRLLVENQNELVVKVDNEGRFLFVNHAYCKLFGMESAQLIGYNYEPLIHPDDVEITRKAMKQLTTPPYTCYVEQRAQTIQGWRWLAWSDKALLDEKGKIIAVIGVGRDISEQRKIEQDLVESEIKFQKAFLNSPNLMSISRIKDGLLYDVNNKFASILGLSREDVIGKLTRDLGLFDAMPRSTIESLIRHQGKIEDVEFKITLGGNKEMEGLFSSEVIELNGESCMVSSFSDITELKLAQRELENYRTHLEGLVDQRTARILEVNEELDRFANSVSHDLKAPLRVMQGYVNALLDDHAGALDPEATDYLNRIKKVSKQMEFLINDLLQYSRLSSLELGLGPVSPVKAVAKALEIHKEEIASRKAVIHVSDYIPQVWSYMPVLVQVFSNLISNSLKFTANEIVPVLEISGQSIEGKVLVTIKDNGIGIPLDKQGRIFDVFERLHGVESYPGNGIGLTIVRKAMERMGGEVTVSSSPGSGSAFTLVMQPAALYI